MNDSRRRHTVGGRIPSDAVPFLAELAGRAPSVHNTQPWRFQLTADGSLELHADASRQLRHTDPAGRELHISCGAALFGLRLAVRLMGYEPEVTLLPEPARAELLARVRYGTRRPVEPADRLLLSAMGRRHTHRSDFTPEPVSQTVLTALQQAAAELRAQLCVVHELTSRRLLRSLVRQADQRQRADLAVRAELDAWTPPRRSGRRDGVPETAYPRRPAHRTDEPVVRDFSHGRDQGTLPAPTAPATTAAALLITADDTRSDWLAAGEALHHALLVAAQHWVFARVHSQPLQLPDLRTQLSGRLALPGYPQMLLTLGHAHLAPITPRRPTSETISRQPATAPPVATRTTTTLSLTATD